MVFRGSISLLLALSCFFYLGLHPGSTEVFGALFRPPVEFDTRTACVKVFGLCWYLYECPMLKNLLSRVLLWVASLTFQYLVFPNSNVACGQVCTYLSSILMAFRDKIL